MASEANTTASLQHESEKHHHHHLKDVLPKDRRYVGTKETVAYILYDISRSFNIGKYNDIFITDIVKIGLKFQPIVTLIVGLWDIINDVFLATFIDKTRTRFGKFKPYLVIYAIPGVLLSLFYWWLPVIFSGRDPYNIVMLTTYMVFSLVSNFAGSMNEIARVGMLSTITPNILDRTRLITQANLLSGFVEKGPEILMGVFIDLVNNGKINIKMTSLYVSAGTFTTVVAGAMAFYFACVAKERVMQTVEKPSVKENFKSIFKNKPLLLITLSEFLGAFSISSGTNFYYINVLGLASMSTIVGIPGAIVSPISYSYVPWARRKFSTKALWLVSSHIGDVLMLGVYIVGSINKNFKKRLPMILAFMARETLWMFVWGLRSVIPEEMRNEAIDYGEWKNGYRNEGMTGVAKGLATKFVSTFGGTIKGAILASIGYNQENAGYGKQSEKVERSLFAMCTILPVATGALSVIPKLFYDLSGEKRDRMYRELHERRKLAMKKEDVSKDKQNNGEEPETGSAG
ncbi:MAG: MFS transporter [Clostridiales bacterium]|nr:MFS transporter [Clostridiales bacterium]